MQFKKLEPTKYILRFDTGDRFAESFLKFCADEHVTSAFFSGIGSLEEATLGFYDTVADKYNWTTLNGLHEILSMDGNVATFDGTTMFHAHLIAGTHDLSTIGGHLKDLTVGATCELMLTTVATQMTRKQSSYKELKTLDL